MIIRYLLFAFLFIGTTVFGQQTDKSLLTIDRVFASGEFRQQPMIQYQWAEDGEAFITREPAKDGGFNIMSYSTASQKGKELVKAREMKLGDEPLAIESFRLSHDESKLLIFNNSKRVWRSNTKGDYYVLDLGSKKLKQIGNSKPASSLMFAKFSPNNKYVGYVSDFNIYIEDYKSGKVTALTTDGTKDIINGTFDWVYEEELGCRDGFRWSPDSRHIAFWQLDASNIGTFYMINNTDSVYSKIIPLQYPKVGDKPASAKVGTVNIANKKIEWIPIPGEADNNYLPRMQWINDDELLIQQLNRLQNKLTVWKYNITSKDLKKLYIEKEDTWVDISYPDAVSNSWGMKDLEIVEDGKYFLRMSENGKWRHVRKVNIKTGKVTQLTPNTYDVASVLGNDGKHLFYMASPKTSTERYLYSVPLKGNKKDKQLTPDSYKGMNNYNISPNGRFAFHNHSSIKDVPTTRLVNLSNHHTLKTYVDNKEYNKKLAQLALPDEEMFTVTTEDGIEIDGKIMYPVGFDKTKKYPVLFYVYGEPWGAVAQNSWSGMWNKMLAQQGYVIISMDNRGTPCLKGSEWRKSIYKQIGRINANDQAKAAKEVLKWDFLDADRTAVWGWSGGGSMTLNLMFKYPEIYTTGMSVAPVGNQLYYDNIYTERYMGLPQDDMQNFIDGSPVTYAKGLEGNLLIVHGTGDDNVHYQNAEGVINELIKHNKQFDMMSYPNRSHGIYEGKNTRRHLYTLLTNYLNEHVEPGPRNRISN